MRLHLDNWYENMRQATRRGTESRSWQRCWRSCRTNIGSGWGTCTKESSTNVLNLAYLSYTQIRWTRQQLLSSPGHGKSWQLLPACAHITPRNTQNKAWVDLSMTWNESKYLLTFNAIGYRAASAAPASRRRAPPRKFRAKKSVYGKNLKKRGPFGPH